MAIHLTDYFYRVFHPTKKMGMGTLPFKAKISQDEKNLQMTRERRRRLSAQLVNAKNGIIKCDKMLRESPDAEKLLKIQNARAHFRQMEEELSLIFKVQGN